MKMQFHKAVVKVLVIVATDRTKTPVSLTFEDGKEYSIDRVCSRQRAAATKVGGTGIRYTISPVSQGCPALVHLRPARRVLDEYLIKTALDFPLALVPRLGG